MSLCVILKTFSWKTETFSWKTARDISNQLFIDGLLTIHFYYFNQKDHIDKFRNYLNKQHKNITFTSKIEDNGSVSFLDIKISHENNNL